MSNQFRTETCILVARQYLALDVWIEPSDSPSGGDDRSSPGTSRTVAPFQTLEQREQQKKVAHARAVCHEVSGRWVYSSVVDLAMTTCTSPNIPSATMRIYFVFREYTAGTSL
jgi:hypothetical protein